MAIAANGELEDFDPHKKDKEAKEQGLIKVMELNMTTVGVKQSKTLGLPLAEGVHVMAYGLDPNEIAPKDTVNVVE